MAEDPPTRDEVEPGYFMLPLVARGKLIEVLYLEQLMVLSELGEEAKADIKWFKKRVIRVHLTIKHQIRLELDLGGSVPVAYGYLRCRTPREQLNYLMELFRCDVIMWFDDGCHVHNLDTIFGIVEGTNVVSMMFIECDPNYSRDVLQRLPPTTKEVFVLRDPSLLNFPNVFGRQFETLFFLARFPLRFADILSLNCKHTQIFKGIVSVNELASLLKSWIKGWNPSMKTFVIVLKKRELEDNYIEQIVHDIPRKACSISENRVFKKKSVLWITCRQTDAVFKIERKLEDGTLSTAKLIFETFGMTVRIKMIVGGDTIPSVSSSRLSNPPLRPLRSPIPRSRFFVNLFAFLPLILGIFVSFFISVSSLFKLIKQYFNRNTQ